ncbi:sulfatase-like hydrolase/transferase [Mycolicibacterium sp. J2]|uniref:sulfatase-like hydrolase/transferase n=1 Tax=Mycolicibacterium sp. J2 TaxID=2993511 RepID=UPI00224A9F13|nr:sulfatase-like hydrolase/transferase [Mycolicibacterium sp. J2]MCX2713024.1 sulfatase-like hydrolase/transferase [Mycolicibacterium sp. J2]
MTISSGPSRRAFLAMAGVSVAAAAAACTAKPADTPSAPKAGLPSAAKHNIVFVFTDQERYFNEWPSGMSLPGRERLRNDGVAFTNHYCPAVMCTSSRAVILTGLQTPDNGMFENVDMPYVHSMNPDIPTVGDMLRKAGYYTAYKGKWHLNSAFETEQPDYLFTKEMEAYGFSDYVWPGDVLTHTLGGYHYDNMIGGSAVSWLRDQGRSLADENKPWALFVSLVNPHDIMYFNTDAPGQNVQDNGRLLMEAARAPENELYAKTWDTALPKSLTQPMDEPGRPAAHGEYLKAWGYTLGTVPPEEERWRRFSDFYLNSIRSVDQQLAQLLGELDNLKLTDNTIVVFTSDHGEMGGAHGLRGKGPFAYQEAIHLPMHIMHPDVAGGQDVSSLTGHIDLVPSLLAFAGVSKGSEGEVAGRDLPGRDFSAALGNPRAADEHTVRDAVLFTYSGLATNDSEVIRIVADAKAAHKDPKKAMAEAGYRPDLNKRGSLRTMFDGRYKFTRYFAPTQRNLPRDLDELYRYNDVELFDLQNDPAEMTNLAAAQGENAELVLAASAKLESLIKAEIGVDDGREMPHFDDIDWTIDRLDL